MPTKGMTAVGRVLAGERYLSSIIPVTTAAWIAADWAKWMARALGRIIMVPIGFVLAALATPFVIVSLGQERKSGQADFS